MPVRCYVLMPLQNSEAFLQRLNRILLILGLVAVAVSILLVLYISQTVTRPLESLVAAVRALAGGNYTYSMSPKGTTEVAQLGAAFAGMRQQLLESQRHRIQAERMAALSRTASSISHDLRHYLAALLANAEFLYEAESLHLDREDVYREIKIASDQMTELIDSFRELANDHAAIMPAPASMEETMKRAHRGSEITSSFPRAFRPDRYAWHDEWRVRCTQAGASVFQFNPERVRSHQHPWSDHGRNHLERASSLKFAYLMMVQAFLPLSAIRSSNRL